jgi:2',3'-cyclic-nucleotide 2'-phosphodiesterase (5'-nucleotidase family)
LTGTINAKVVHVVIVYSHNTNGVLENCDCPEKSYGALEKRAAVIDSIRKIEDHVLLLDTGDILDIMPSKLLHKYVVKAYDFMKYDFWTPGDQDFVEGSSFFNEKLSNISGSVLSTNILYKDKPIGKSNAIKKFDNIRIGITATIREDLHKYLDRPSQEEFIFLNQINSLDPVITKLANEVDYVILLSHSGIEHDRQISQKFPSIDLIIGGHSQTILNKPEKIGATSITQVGESGYRLGIMKLTFENNEIQKMENRIILLDRNMPDDPAVKEMIRKYHEERLAEK